MRFKNVTTEDGTVLSDMSMMSLSDNEFRNYGAAGLKQHNNLVETPNAKYKLQIGTFDLIFNNEHYTIYVEEAVGSELPYSFLVKVKDLELRLEKLRPITKYDFIREFVKNFKKLSLKGDVGNEKQRT